MTHPATTVTLFLIIQLSTTRTSIYVTLLTDLKGFLHCINGYFWKHHTICSGNEQIVFYTLCQSAFHACNI